MSLRQLVKRALRPIARPLLDRIARATSELAHHHTSQKSEKTQFDLQVLLALRSLVAANDYRVIPPHDSWRAPRNPREIKVGFFGNIANNAYNFCKCLRQLRYDAELVVEDGFFDSFIMNRPFWEDLPVDCNGYEEGLSHEHKWTQPHFVRRVAYDAEMQARFQDSYEAVSKVQALYNEEFALELPADRALVLAQQMGHWPYLLAMKNYDVVQLSGAAISMGPFCPRPYVVFPTGGDLFVSPFQETLLGMLMRAGYRNSARVLVCEPNYPQYLDRLELRAPCSYAPLMVDTDTYAPGDGGDARVRWIRESGGNRFLLGVCRQSWEWKGNDRLIHGFAAFVNKRTHSDWRMVLMEWGPDVAETKRLIAELGIESYILWQKLSAKPLVRKFQQAADLIADEFVMPGYGTSVLESMAAGRPVLMRPPDGNTTRYFQDPPPFLGAVRPEEICERLEEVSEDRVRDVAGAESLDWVRKHHGYRATVDTYVEAYVAALEIANRVGR